MRKRNLSLPDIAMIAGTRVALGAGIGLLLSSRLRKSERKAAGWALFAVGAFTSIPLFMKIRESRRLTEETAGATVEANVPL